MIMNVRDYESKKADSIGSIIREQEKIEYNEWKVNFILKAVAVGVLLIGLLALIIL